MSFILNRFSINVLKWVDKEVRDIVKLTEHPQMKSWAHISSIHIKIFTLAYICRPSTREMDKGRSLFHAEHADCPNWWIIGLVRVHASYNKVDSDWKTNKHTHTCMHIPTWMYMNTYTHMNMSIYIHHTITRIHTYKQWIKYYTRMMIM